jgi:hypothetical protein
VYDNSGTPTLERSANWTNATTRVDALTLLNGVYVKASDNTRRYVGSARWVGGLSAYYNYHHSRGIYNYCNAVWDYQTNQGNTTDTTTKSTTTWATISTNNQFSRMIGIAGDYVSYIDAYTIGSAASTTGVSAGVGIGSATSNSAQLMGGFADASLPHQLLGFYQGYPAYGLVSYSDSTTTTGTNATFFGDNGTTKITSQGFAVGFYH